MPLTLKQLRKRIENEIANSQAPWVCEQLAKRLELDRPSCSQTPTVAFVVADALTTAGHYLGTSPPESAETTTAVVLDGQVGQFMVKHLDKPTGSVRRCLCTTAVWEHDAEHGLVLTELAPGHSARELQQEAPSPLVVGCTLTEMQLVAPA